MQSTHQTTTSETTASDIPQNSPSFPSGGNDLNDKQRLAIEMLAAGRGYGETASELQIDRKTLYNWRRDEAFQDALDDRRKELWRRASDRIRSLLNPAIDVIEQHLKDRYDRSRFRAAAALLRVAGLNKSVRTD